MALLCGCDDPMLGPLTECAGIFSVCLFVWYAVLMSRNGETAVSAPTRSVWIHRCRVHVLQSYLLRGMISFADFCLVNFLSF